MCYKRYHLSIIPKKDRIIKQKVKLTAIDFHRRFMIVFCYGLWKDMSLMILDFGGI